MNASNLFGTSVVVSPFVGPSVRQSVRQGGSDGRLTDAGVGELWAGESAVIPALVARLVQGPVETIAPVARYHHVVVVKVVPRAQVDPVLPFLLGIADGVYWYWYRRYWRALMGLLGGNPLATRRNLARLQRRVLARVADLPITPREKAVFAVWMEHGPLGEYRMEGVW